MINICILTDSTAIFSPLSRQDRQIIYVMPFKSDGAGVHHPLVNDFMRIFSVLEHEFKAILVLTSSEAITPFYEIAKQAASSHGGSVKIQVLDTRQIGSGVGMLAQLAARKVAEGVDMLELEEYIRSVIPFMFTLLCPGLTPKAGDGNPTKPKLEKMDLSQLYCLEDGQLIPYKKVRTQRHLLQSLQEFLREFEKPQVLAYFHAKNADKHNHSLWDVAGSLFPAMQFYNLDMNDSLSQLVGEQAIGLTILEITQSSN